MRAGQWLVIGLVVAGIATGAGVWYTQNYAFYNQIDPGSDRARVMVVNIDDGKPQPLSLRDFKGIDATSSPIKYRACFTTDPPEPDTVLPYLDPTPLIGPRWFDCFDAGALTEDLASGEAVAYLSAAEIRPDVDRIVAIYPDGRAYAWQQYNPKTPERGVMD